MIRDSGNEIGPFRAIEESTLAQLTPAAERSDIYAWYSLIGTAGSAFGMLVCGWILHQLKFELQWDTVRRYRAMFFGYAVFGIIKLLLAIALSRAVEAEKKLQPIQDPETAPLLGDGAEEVEPKKKWYQKVLPSRSLLPEISSESKLIVVDLCVLFALDAFASGLVPLSWTTWFFIDKFNMEEGKLGTLFFITSIIAAVSVLVASSISKRFGNIKVCRRMTLDCQLLTTIITDNGLHSPPIGYFPCHDPHT